MHHLLRFFAICGTLINLGKPVFVLKADRGLEVVGQPRDTGLHQHRYMKFLGLKADSGPSKKPIWVLCKKLSVECVECVLLGALWLRKCNTRPHYS